MTKANLSKVLGSYSTTWLSDTLSFVLSADGYFIVNTSFKTRHDLVNTLVDLVVDETIPDMRGVVKQEVCEQTCTGVVVIDDRQYPVTSCALEVALHAIPEHLENLIGPALEYGATILPRTVGQAALLAAVAKTHGAEGFMSVKTILDVAFYPIQTALNQGPAEICVHVLKGGLYLARKHLPEDEHAQSLAALTEEVRRLKDIVENPTPDRRNVQTVEIVYQELSGKVNDLLKYIEDLEMCPTHAILDLERDLGHFLVDFDGEQRHDTGYSRTGRTGRGHRDLTETYRRGDGRGRGGR